MLVMSNGEKFTTNGPTTPLALADKTVAANSCGFRWTVSRKDVFTS